MNQPFPFKSAVVGAFAGALVFAALTAVKAQQVLTVHDFHSNPKAYVGGTVALTGLVASVRSETKTVNGRATPWTKLNLYETDQKGRKTRYYVYVSLPAASFAPAPAEGDKLTVTGPIKWPYEIGAIDAQP